MHKKGCSLWLNFLISSFSHSFISRFFFYNHLLRISNWRIPRFVAKSSSRWRDEGGRFESLLSKPGVLEESLRGLLLKSKSIIPTESSKIRCRFRFLQPQIRCKITISFCKSPSYDASCEKYAAKCEELTKWHQESQIFYMYAYPLSFVQNHKTSSINLRTSWQ